MPTIRGLVWLLLLLAGAAGGGAYWFFTRSDEFLRAELISQLGATFPNAEIQLDRAHFDLTGRIRAYRVRLTLPDDDYSALTISELVITLDRDQLADQQAIQIQKIRAVKPRLWIVRHTDQSWNWQRLQVQRQEGGVLPDLEIEQGQVTVQFEQPPGQSPLDWNGTEFRLLATPASDQSWAISASSRIDGAGPVRVEGDWHLKNGPWKLTAEVQGWVIDQAFLAKVAALRPELRQALDVVDEQWAKIARRRVPTEDGVVQAHAESPLPRSRRLSPGEPLPDLGIQLLTDLQVRVSKSGQAEPVSFQVKSNIRNGRLTNHMLPLPLHELTGEFYADRERIVLKNLSGRHGESTVSCSAKYAADEQPVVTLRARQISLDEALTNRLPESLQPLIRSLSLRGVCDAEAQFTRLETGFLPNIQLTLTRGSILHERFRYPVRDVEGKLNWHGDMAILEGTGHAGTAPVTVNGTIKKPGPGAEMSIIVQAEGVPIDATLLQACPSAVRSSATALELRGTVDNWTRLTKPAGIGAKITPLVVTKLNDCSVHYRHFPLRIDRVSGVVRWDGETAAFQSLTGRHADAEVSCSGRFVREPGPGRLELDFQVTEAPFDADLLEALPTRLQEVWREFQPTGRFDAEAKVAWTPGEPADIRLPWVKLKQAEVTLKHFPFPWYNVAGELSYADEELIVQSLSAEHDDCRLRAAGKGTFPSNRPWQFRATSLFVDDLPTSPALRRALPEELRSLVDTLNPSGTLSIQGPVTLYGPTATREEIGIEWKTDVLLSGSSLTLGQRVENVHGRVNVHGTWDGREAIIHKGLIDLDSLEIFHHKFTQVRGPFSYRQAELLAGSRKAATGPVLQAINDISWVEQISGKAIDGTFTVNGIVDFEAEPHYRLRFLMVGGNLERYAEAYLPGQRDIRGSMNGWLDLHGEGTDAEAMTGSGRLEIRPAELYELPIFFQMFQVLGPQFQDRAAFKEAIFLFNVDKGRFNFQSIDLAGNAIRLLGRGTIRFDGIVALEFYSVLARNRIRVPVISDVIGMLSQGWVGVKVSGNLNDPQVDMRAIPELDDTLRQFLGAFEPRLLAPQNRLTLPRTGQPPGPSRR